MYKLTHDLLVLLFGDSICLLLNNFNFMREKLKRKKEITLNDLAVMVKGGFDDQERRFDSLENRMEGVENRMEGVENRMEGVENRIGKVEGSLDNLWTQTNKLSGEVNKIKDGQEELKDIVSGIYHVEIRDLKNRVEILEKKAGVG
jgi:predicted nuclease with TOPRIM domain